MGTKKGQRRKTARRAYIDTRKANRSQKVRAASQLSFLRKLGNGRKRQGEDLLDSWRTILRDIMKGDMK